MSNYRSPARVDNQVSFTPRRGAKLSVSELMRLARNVGEERARQIDRTLSSGQEATLSPGDRAALQAAEQASVGSSFSESDSAAFKSALAEPPTSGRLVAVDRAGNQTLQAARPDRLSRLQHLTRALSSTTPTSTATPPRSPPAAVSAATNSSRTPRSRSTTAESYSDLLRRHRRGPSDADGAPAATAPAPAPAAEPEAETGTSITPAASATRSLSFGDASIIDSPTLGSSTGPQLERLVGSIETMTDQVNSGMQALASARTGLKGASPDERVQLLETLQNDPQLQELVKAGLMSWDDVMRPNPAEGSEGHVPGVGAGKPVIDSKKLAALQSKLSTAAQRQANDLRRVQQVVERRRTTAGAVPAAAGAFYPGLKVWTPPAFAPPVPPGRN
jgi:hypothetical protein